MEWGHIKLGVPHEQLQLVRHPCSRTVLLHFSVLFCFHVFVKMASGECYEKKVYAPFSQKSRLCEVLTKGVEKCSGNIKTVAKSSNGKRKLPCADPQCSQCSGSASWGEVFSSNLQPKKRTSDAKDDFVTPAKKFCFKKAKLSKGKNILKPTSCVAIKKSVKTIDVALQEPTSPKIRIIQDDVLDKCEMDCPGSSRGNVQIIDQAVPLSGVEYLTNQSAPGLPILKNICENFIENLPPTEDVSEENLLNTGFIQDAEEEIDPVPTNAANANDNFLDSVAIAALEETWNPFEKEEVPLLEPQTSLALEESDNLFKSLIELQAQNIPSLELRKRFDDLVNGSALIADDIGNPPTVNSGGRRPSEEKKLHLKLLKAERSVILAQKKFRSLTFEVERLKFEQKEREYRKEIELLDRKLSDLEADISRA